MQDTEVVDQQLLDAQQVLANLATAESERRYDDVAHGQAIYEKEVTPGMNVQAKRGQPMVHMGGEALPDRVTIWNRRTGREKRISTTLLMRKLAIKDVDGQPKFVVRKPDLPPPEFIKEACEVCIRRGVRKRFEHKWDYVGHMETFHQREWRIIEEERKEKEMISASVLREALAGLSQTERQQLLGGNTNGATEGDAGNTATCPACAWTKSGVKNVAASLRGHRFHCAASSGDAN
jgi:hypothetical protein